MVYRVRSLEASLGGWPATVVPVVQGEHVGKEQVAVAAEAEAEAEAEAVASFAPT